MDDMKSVEMENTFTNNFNEHIGDDRAGTTYSGARYLPWANAWAKFKEKYPSGSFKINWFEESTLLTETNDNGEIISHIEKIPKPYFNDSGFGIMVSVSLSLNGDSYMEPTILPVMDSANASMKDHSYKYETKKGEKVCPAADMTDINRAIQRCLVKAIAIHTGIGLQFWIKEEEEKLYLDSVITAEKAERLESRIKAMKISTAYILQQVNVKFNTHVDELRDLKISQYDWVMKSIDFQIEQNNKMKKEAAKTIEARKKTAQEEKQEQFDAPEFLNEAG